MYLHMYTGRNLYMIPLILHTILRHIWGVSICSNSQLVSSISSRSYSDVLSVNCEQKWEAFAIIQISVVSTVTRDLPGTMERHYIV